MDSLDLTFVRCPSCRSLVPAISTRCRMCGASLEAAATPESLAGGADKNATNPASLTAGSQTSAGHESASGSKELNGSPTSFDAGSKPLSSASATSEDPLSAYVEEISSGSSLEGDVNISSDEATPSASRVSMSSSSNAGSGSITSGSMLNAGASSAAAGVVSGSAAVEMNRMEQQAPVSPPKQGFEARRNTQERRYQSPNSGTSTSMSSSKEGNMSNSGNSNRRSDARTQETRVGGAQPAVLSGAGSAAVRTAVQSGATSPGGISASGMPASRSRETPVFGSGRLVGWLVSYADARGASLELREGKFFVTAKSIKEHDLVLEDRSVSTPHALVGCGRDGGLTVQDLMSERGVFVRRRGSNQYRQEEEAIPVEHGDWLRFGDLEFLVVLIPAGAE